MSAIELSLDTNILFYAFDARDAVKHRVANRILTYCYKARSQVALQCLSEFYNSATRKGLVSPEEAAAIVYDLRRGLNSVPYEWADVVAGMKLHETCGFQFFDCQIVATMGRAGCTVLFTEDMQHGRTLHGVEILNPFKLGAQELDRLMV